MQYDNNFKDNIPYNLFNFSAKNVLNWINDNREKYDWAKDPNAYEMTNLFLFASKYRNEGEMIDISCIKDLWNVRKDDFQECDISENSFVYKIVQDAYQSVINGEPLVTDSDSHDALRKMAGIGLNLYQQKRDNGQIIYNNPQELMELLSHSKSLKKSHPDLFQKYSFQVNIDKLCELQLSQELPEEIKDAITEQQSQLLEAMPDLDLTFGREDYSLEKLLEDSEQIFEFIHKTERNTDTKNKQNSPAANYYYSLNFELSHAKLDNKDLRNNLEKAIDSICKKYAVKFDSLLSFSKQSRECLTNINSQEAKDLYEKLQNGAIEYFTDRKDKETLESQKNDDSRYTDQK